MNSRVSSSLVVIGFALLSLTPAAPGLLRNADLLLIHVYGWFDAGLETLREQLSESEPRLVGAPGPWPERARDGVRRWDAVLTSGADITCPGEARLVARIVELDLRRRRLLIDAGAEVQLEVGNAVLAGEIGVGRVAEVTGPGIAVVETPWTPDVRFAGVCAAADSTVDIRFVLVGLARDRFLASVTNPERDRGLRVGADVWAPDLTDMRLGSVATLPAGLRIGRLEADELTERTRGKVAYCVSPIVDLELLDAVVVVGVEPPPQADPNRASFVTMRGARLSCGLLSPWRDGLAVTGEGLQAGADVSSGEGFALGRIDSALLGAARVRGLFDPGRRDVFLVVPGEGEPYPIVATALSTAPASSSGRLRLDKSPALRAPEVGDLIATGGRGAHRPRGRPVGIVSEAGEGWFSVRRVEGASSEMIFHVRRDFPARPWGG